MDRTPACYIVNLTEGWNLEPVYSVDQSLSDAELDLLCDLAMRDVDRSNWVRGDRGTNRQSR